MILIFAPYPWLSEIKDGWKARIGAIDRIFKDRPRFYVFPGNPLFGAFPYNLLFGSNLNDYRIDIDQVEDSAWFWRMDGRFALHWRRLTELVEECDFVYAHTCHSSQVLLPYYQTGKVITDIHGIAPEEEAQRGKPNSAKFFGAFEETMVRESAALVTVTQSMGDHYKAKYPGLETPMVNLPIVDDHFLGVSIDRPPRQRLRIVYAGGAQAWQSLDLMFEIVKKCHDRFDFAFFSQDSAAMETAAWHHGVKDYVKITNCSRDQLGEVYAGADLGLVLRDDSPVNRVACPTKLSEYLATGVVPIVNLVEIGDFAQLGYHYLTVEDLLSGEPLNHERLNDYRKRNRAVFETIAKNHDQGKKVLRELPNPTPRLDMAESKSLFLTPMERTKVFPCRGAELIYVRGGVTFTTALNDVTHPHKEYVFELDGDGPLTALSYYPMERPFVTTPISIDVISDSGGTHRCRTRGNFGYDLFGNWIFDRGRPVVKVSGLRVLDAHSVRIRFELVLCSTEANLARRSSIGRMRSGGATR